MIVCVCVCVCVCGCVCVTTHVQSYLCFMFLCSCAAGSIPGEQRCVCALARLHHQESAPAPTSPHRKCVRVCIYFCMFI